MVSTETKSKVLALAEALKAAQAAADHAAKYSDDNGTCNFDTVVIRLKGWRKEDIAAASNAAGVTIDDDSSSTRGRFVFFRTNGQADRNTRGMEAAKKSLAEAGYDVGMWYCMD